MTRLMLAAKTCDLKCVQMLAPLEHGMRDARNRAAIWYTASCIADEGYRSYQILKEYEDERDSDQYSIIVSVWEDADNSSIKNLFDAAYHGCSACCRRLIGEAGRTKNDISYSGWYETKKKITALMVAVRYGSNGCARILTDRETRM